VRIRALRADDTELERRFVGGLSPETLFLRVQYHGGQPTPHDLERLLDLDYVDRLAIAGLVGNEDLQRIVGVSRFARVEDTTRAECAIVVADDWQGCGLGTELMRSLIQAALARGYTSLEGETLAENVGVSAGFEPPTSALLCNAGIGAARGFAPTPRQWGFDIFRTWRF
jgi:acetyltransferase